MHANRFLSAHSRMPWADVPKKSRGGKGAIKPPADDMEAAAARVKPKKAANAAKTIIGKLAHKVEWANWLSRRAKGPGSSYVLLAVTAEEDGATESIGFDDDPTRQRITVLGDPEHAASILARAAHAMWRKFGGAGTVAAAGAVTGAPAAATAHTPETPSPAALRAKHDDELKRLRFFQRGEAFRRRVAHLESTDRGVLDSEARARGGMETAIVAAASAPAAAHDAALPASQMSAASGLSDASTATGTTAWQVTEHSQDLDNVDSGGSQGSQGNSGSETLL